MRNLMTWLGGASLGAGAMYLMDPDRGDRRRAELRHVFSDLADSNLVQRAQSELTQRAEQFDAGETARQVGSQVSSGVAQLGNAVSRLGTGAGTMLESSSAWLPALGSAAIPALRSMGLRRRRTPTLSAGDWVLLGGVVGLVVTGLWLARRAGRGEGIDVARTIRIDAPLERVYDFWNEFENFPRFMSHVREVRRVGPDRTHWVVAGPVGAPIEWDAVVTERTANSVIGWRTVEGAVVEHHGTVRFRSLGAGATMVEVRLTYRPVGGALGHGLASLLGSDPERVIGEDLNRVAAQLRAPRPAAGEWR
jgi:uncharacterized membrane protein